jgi:hypothetical protein
MRCGACGTHGRQERCTQGFGGGAPEGKNHFENLDVNERILLKLIFEKCDEEAWTRLISLSIETASESL